MPSRRRRVTPRDEGAALPWGRRPGTPGMAAQQQQEEEAGLRGPGRGRRPRAGLCSLAALALLLLAALAYLPPLLLAYRSHGAGPGGGAGGRRGGLGGGA